MHIFSFNNLVELLDERNAALEDGLNKVVITPLHNYAIAPNKIRDRGHGNCETQEVQLWIRISNFREIIR